MNMCVYVGVCLWMGIVDGCVCVSVYGYECAYVRVYGVCECVYVDCGWMCECGVYVDVDCSCVCVSGCV